MKKISAHISYNEATRSQTAIRKGLNNTPGAKQIENIQLWAEKVFELLREHVSNKRGKDSPIHINSIYRSVAVNASVGGSKTSQHCAGEASKMEEAAGDIETNYDDFNNKDLFMLIKNKGVFDQLIWEYGDDKAPDWVHVSYRKGANRHQVLKVTRVNGKSKYSPFS